MLKNNFPKNNDEAKAYGGDMLDDNTFFKVFPFEKSLNRTLESINTFLFDNGYHKVISEEFDEEMSYENHKFSISKHGYKEELVLLIKNPARIFELSGVLRKLQDFRDERDWEQFHNSKDLALAISIEASELLELFLWKNADDVDMNKMEDELADVLSFCFLLAEKNGINIPEIVANKIAKNALKYPVSKAKGTAKKYNEL